MNEASEVKAIIDHEKWLLDIIAEFAENDWIIEPNKNSNERLTTFRNAEGLVLQAWRAGGYKADTKLEFSLRPPNDGGPTRYRSWREWYVFPRDVVEHTASVSLGRNAHHVYNEVIRKVVVPMAPYHETAMAKAEENTKRRDNMLVVAQRIAKLCNSVVDERMREDIFRDSRIRFRLPRGAYGHVEIGLGGQLKIESDLPLENFTAFLKLLPKATKE